MNKVELIKAVAEATNNTQKDIKVIMEAVQDVTYGALVKGDEVKLMDGVSVKSLNTDYLTNGANTLILNCGTSV